MALRVRRHLALLIDPSKIYMLLRSRHKHRGPACAHAHPSASLLLLLLLQYLSALDTAGPPADRAVFLNSWQWWRPAYIEAAPGSAAGRSAPGLLVLWAYDMLSVPAVASTQWSVEASIFASTSICQFAAAWRRLATPSAVGPRLQACPQPMVSAEPAHLHRPESGSTQDSKHPPAGRCLRANSLTIQWTHCDNP